MAYDDNYDRAGRSRRHTLTNALLRPKQSIQNLLARKESVDALPALQRDGGDDDDDARSSVRTVLAGDAQPRGSFSFVAGDDAPYIRGAAQAGDDADDGGSLYTYQSSVYSQEAAGPAPMPTGPGMLRRMKGTFTLGKRKSNGDVFQQPQQANRSDGLGTLRPARSMVNLFLRASSSRQESGLRASLDPDGELEYVRAGPYQQQKSGAARGRAMTVATQNVPRARHAPGVDVDSQLSGVSPTSGEALPAAAAAAAAATTSSSSVSAQRQPPGCKRPIDWPGVLPPNLTPPMTIHPAFRGDSGASASAAQEATLKANLQQIREMRVEEARTGVRRSKLELETMQTVVAHMARARSASEALRQSGLLSEDEEYQEMLKRITS